VVDHGVGLPVNYDFKKPKTLGLRLVSVLIKQLQADMVVANSKGVDYNIQYKIQDIKTQRFIQKPKLALN
jgi:two-component sensor histidine kinase